MKAITLLILLAILSPFLMIAEGAGVQASPQWIGIRGESGDQLRAAVFRPAGKGPFPLIFVFHGIVGLDEPTLEWSRALAQAGFVTVAGCYVNGGLSLRDGDDRVDPCPGVRGMYDDVDLLLNVRAVLAAGRRLPGVRRDRVGLVGHALGGNIILVLASSGMNVGGAVAFSADPSRPLQLPQKPSGSALPAPIWSVEDLTAPVVLFHGMADPSVLATSVSEYVRRALSRGKDVQAYYYADAGRALWVSNNQPALIAQTVSFFRRHLGR